MIGHVCNLGRSAIVPLIDASGAFDSLSWRLIDETLGKQKVDDKGRAIFRTIYTGISGIVRVRALSGEEVYSDKFYPGGGIVQGGKDSPDVWIIGLAELLRIVDIGRFPSAGPGEMYPVARY